MISKASITTVLSLIVVTTMVVASKAASLGSILKPISDRKLSPTRYSYNDGLTICPCDDKNGCTKYIELEGLSEIRLCFFTQSGDSSDVTFLSDLTLDIGPQETPVIVNGDVQAGSTVWHEPKTCIAKAPVSVDGSKLQPGVVVARGTLVLQDADGLLEDISFAQIIRLKSKVDNSGTPPAELVVDGEEEFETSGYAMITGVVILLPGVWGAAMYMFHSLCHAEEDDLNENQVVPDDENDVEDGNLKRKQVVVEKVNAGTDEEWETIVFD